MLKLGGNDIMDKVLKVAKLNLKDMIKRVSIFYCIFISYLMLIMRLVDKDTVPLYGMDIFAFIFMIFCGLYTFNKKFKIAQGNNVSRKSFVKGIVISIIPVAAFMSVFEVLINRGMNAFIKSPTTYDNMFGNFRSLRGLGNYSEWIQDNGFITIINTILLLFMMYCIGYLAAFVLNMIYCRFNEGMRLVIIVIPVIFLKVLDIFGVEQLVFVLYDINEYAKDIFNLNSKSILPVLLCYGALFLILYVVAHIVIRKATVQGAKSRE